jgi:bleomycin hydrolase
MKHKDQKTSSGPVLRSYNTSSKIKILKDAIKQDLKDNISVSKKAFKHLQTIHEEELKAEYKSRLFKEGIELSLDIVSAYSKDYTRDQSNIMRMNVLSNLPASDCAENRKYLQNINYSYSHSLSRVPRATSQAYSGRCWLFAALNAMRYYLIKEFNLADDFELSEAYLFFYDKLERANLFLELMITYKERDINDPLLKSLMCDCAPIQDGGTWNYVVNLINKYGILPKTIYGESFNSSVSDEMNGIIYDKLCQFTKIIRDSKLSHYKLREMVIKQMMPDIYKLLSNFMGEPLKADEDFTWSYNEAGENVESQRQKGNYHSVQNLTPVSFYSNYIQDHYDVNKMVLLRNDPRKSSKYYKVYSKENSTNMVNGKKELSFNLPMEEIKHYTATSIMSNTPVWFACEVQRDFHPYYGLLAVEAYDYDNLLGLSMSQTKADGLYMRNCGPSHAMAIVGLNKIGGSENVHIIDKWKIENSWGEWSDNDPGYLQMSDKWFDRHGYEVVVPLDLLKDELKDIYKANVEMPIVLPYNDQFSAFKL